jgi:hypothetical protein
MAAQEYMKNERKKKNWQYFVPHWVPERMM